MSEANAGKEFDEIVSQYNHWLAFHENIQLGKKRRRKNFLLVFASIFGVYYSKPAEEPHPVYGRKDLTGEQQDCISLASDWRRVSNKLEKIIADEAGNSRNSIVATMVQKQMAEEMYLNLKQKYIACAGK